MPWGGICQDMLNIQENIPLAPLTTFEIGGSARYFAEAKSEGELREALLWARSNGLPHILIAGGSNVLLPDDAIEGLVIKIAMNKWSVSATVLEAEGGCNLLDLIKKTGALGLGGWEKLAGVPGTIGGAVRGNAGAFGTEIKDVLVSAKALNIHTFETREFHNTSCDFAYRNSFFKKNPAWIVTLVQVRLAQRDNQSIAASIDETIAERERRHIQNVRAAGSYFMNPIATQSVREQFETEKGVKSREGRVPAGWLIEKAGMKGVIEGDAQCSPQHADYIVNRGAAKANDVKILAEKIKIAVRKKFGIELREEAVVF